MGKRGPRRLNLLGVIENHAARVAWFSVPALGYSTFQAVLGYNFNTANRLCGGLERHGIGTTWPALIIFWSCDRQHAGLSDDRFTFATDTQAAVARIFWLLAADYDDEPEIRIAAVPLSEDLKTDWPATDDEDLVIQHIMRKMRVWQASLDTAQRRWLAGQRAQMNRHSVKGAA